MNTSPLLQRIIDLEDRLEAMSIIAGSFVFNESADAATEGRDSVAVLTLDMIDAQLKGRFGELDPRRKRVLEHAYAFLEGAMPGRNPLQRDGANEEP